MLSKRSAAWRQILCLCVQLALLAPLAVGIVAPAKRLCVCGMKASECSCDLAMHAARRMGLRCRCAVRAPGPPAGQVPAASPEATERLGTIRCYALDPSLAPCGRLAALALQRPSAVFLSPELPPPLRLLSVS